jgi:hypothetical protein
MYFPFTTVQVYKIECVAFYGKYADRHKIEPISTSIPSHDRRGKQSISRTVPLRGNEGPVSESFW